MMSVKISRIRVSAAIRPTRRVPGYRCRRQLQYCWLELDNYIQTLPRVIELPITRTEINLSVAHMAFYGLRSQDALHLATAIHYQIPVFWTCDDHFNRVDDLSVEVIRDHD